MSFRQKTIDLVERRSAEGPLVGGIVLKDAEGLLVFGAVPEPLRTMDPIPPERRAVEDRPAMDDIIPVVRIHNQRFWARIMTQKNLGLGEAYIDDDFSMENGSVWHLIAFFIRNDLDHVLTVGAWEKLKLFWMYTKWRWSESENAHIADHYDMGDDVMNPMLGRTGVYSCGYVINEKDELDQLQENKLNLIFSKLRLQPGEHVLDTGCGNGGALVHAAQAYGVTGEGFNNSYNMVRLARENVARNGLSDKLKISLDDFGALEKYPDNTFDAIYETGVWEHLAYEDYRYVMSQCHRILKPNGRLLIHSMGDIRHRHVRDEYIQKYIFRDSNQIILSKLLLEAERLKFLPGDIENLVRHYHYTLWWWHKNLVDASAQINDKHKLRVQEYFLQCCIAQSRYAAGAVYHVLLYKSRHEFTQLHRVTKDNMQRPPLLMRSNAENEVALTGPQVRPEKFEERVYRRPSLARRLSRLASLLFRFYH